MGAVDLLSGNILQTYVSTTLVQLDTMIPQSMLQACLMILFVLFAEINGAQSSTTAILSIVNCTEGITYNKECSTSCNHAYGKCNSQAINRNNTLSRYACSRVQGQCMKDCYATAREKCDASSKSDTEKNDDNQTINKGSKSSHIGASIGIIIVIGVVVYILWVKMTYKRNSEGDIVEYHQVLDQEVREVEGEGRALENQSSSLVENIPTTEARAIAEATSDGNSFNEGRSSILPSGGSEMILSINGNITATAF